MSRIGIVMAAKDYGRWIVAGVNSIILQTHEDWELVIVDYGSKDGSHSMYQKWSGDEPRITWVDFKPSTDSPVPLEAHNEGFRILKARGECDLIVKFDPDDVMMPNFLQYQAAFFDRDPNLMVTWTAYQYCDEGTVAYGRRFDCSAWHHKLPEECLVPETYMVRATALEEIDGWEWEWGKLGIMAVFDRFLRLLTHFGPDRFKYLDEVLFLYRQHPGQLSQIPHVQSFGEERKQVADGYWLRLEKTGGMVRDDL